MRYPIRAVSKLTGVAIDTLRAWERRYGAVTPTRDGRGRLYSDADVARLRLLRGAVWQGHAIGRIAALSDAQLRKVAAPAASADPARGGAIDTRVLLGAITGFDASTIDAELGRFAATHSADALLQDVVMPLLAEVGDAWHERRATVARLLPDAVELWVGGPRARHYADALGRRAVILPDYETLVRELIPISRL